MPNEVVSLCEEAQTSSAQKMWPQIEHLITGVEKCQARTLSTESISQGLLHPPSLVSRPSTLLWHVPLFVPGPVLVVSLLV